MKRLTALLMIFGFMFGAAYAIERARCCDTTCTCDNGASCTVHGEAGEPCGACVPEGCFGGYSCIHSFIDCLAIPDPGQP